MLSGDEQGSEGESRWMFWCLVEREKIWKMTRGYFCSLVTSLGSIVSGVQQSAGCEHILCFPVLHPTHPLSNTSPSDQTIRPRRGARRTLLVRHRSPPTDHKIRTPRHFPLCDPPDSHIFRPPTTHPLSTSTLSALVRHERVPHPSRRCALAEEAARQPAPLLAPSLEPECERPHSPSLDLDARWPQVALLPPVELDLDAQQTGGAGCRG